MRKPWAPMPDEAFQAIKEAFERTNKTMSDLAAAMVSVANESQHCNRGHKMTRYYEPIVVDPDGVAEVTAYFICEHDDCVEHVSEWCMCGNCWITNPQEEELADFIEREFE